MKKKLTAICLAAAFSLSAMPVSMAASPLKDYIKAELGPLYQENMNIDVPTDMQIKFSADADYKNGPLTLKGKDKEVVDYKTDIDMTNVINAFNLFKTTALTKINSEADPTKKAALLAELDKCVAKGEFKVTIEYPDNANFVVPANVATDKNLVGFTTEAGKNMSNIFEEVAPRVQTAGKIVITVKVKDNVTISVLEKDLANLAFEVKGVKLNDYGRYNVKGSVTGSTTIYSSAELLGTLTYVFNQKEGGQDSESPAGVIGATAILTKQSGSGLGGGGGATPSIPEKEVTVVVGEGAEDKEFKYKKGDKVNLDDINKITRPGYEFEGLFYDPEFTKPVEESFVINDNIKLYAKWKKAEIVLESELHMAYIIGYPMENGVEEVRPEGNITREEIATVFYRLLKDEKRNEIFTDKSDFTDVAIDRWSNKAISTMAKGGYVNGYEDGTFKPANSITRAEFVTIVSRFLGVNADTAVDSANFTDTADHWAKTYIDYAAGAKWLSGYEDGTFKPEQAITRAEAMKIINNLLDRHVNEEGLVNVEEKTWADNDKDAWYYYDVIEATNPHKYERAEDVEYEVWTEIVDNEVLLQKPTREDAE